MANQDKYLIFSGVISLTLLLVVLTLFTMMLLDADKVKSYGVKKKNYVTVSLETPKVDAPSSTVQESVMQKSKEIDINNLFSDVWTKKIIHKQKEKIQDKRRLLDIQKKLHTSKENSVKSISDKVKTMDTVASKKETPSSSTAEAVNEYLAKIQAIVYQHFEVPQNSQGSSVKSVIELNAFGKVLDFRILRYSSNEALNEEADRIKNRLMHVVFPQNPNHTSSKTVVILISKE